ncbi:MAG: hypothetical protein ABT04_04325 [Granulicella sp. SCN 62-9]|nr:MAG: hypothetical protein ABT04_04325 [Granulicella sp. SCN 62-9]
MIEVNMLLDLLDISRQRLTDNKFHRRTVCRICSSSRTKSKQANVAAAVDHEVGLKAEIKTVGVPNAQFENTQQVASQFREPHGTSQVAMVTAVPERDLAILRKGLQKFEAKRTVLRARR